MNRYGFKSDLLLHAAALCLVVDIIENGLLRVPLCNFQVLESNGDHALGCLCSLTARDAVPFDRECDIGGFECLGTEFEPISISCLLRLRFDLEDIAVVGDPEQDIAENAVVAEHILVFEIGPVAPAVHHYNKLIGSCREHSAQIELSSVVRAFRVSDKPSVQIQIHTAGNAEERDHVVLVRIADLKVSAVNADKIVLLTGILVAKRELLVHAHPGEDPADLFGCRDHRRFERKLIADIDIERLVIAPELPAGGNIDRIEFCVLGVQDLRHFRGPFIEFEVPVAEVLSG